MAADKMSPDPELARANAPGVETRCRWCVVALAICLIPFLAVEVYDLDIWWHVSIGKEILREAAVPRLDQFSALGLNRPYHDSQWLFQALVATVDELGGMTAVGSIVAVIWGIILTMLFRSVSGVLSPHAAAVLIFIVALACSERFLPRPELITYLGVVLYSHYLAGGRPISRGAAVTLVAYQVFWTNSHGLFVLGPMLAVSAALPLVWEPAADRRTRFASSSMLVAGLLVATLASPYGWRTWEYARLLSTEVGPNAPDIFRQIGELSPVFGPASRSGLAFWFYLPLLLATAGAAIVRLRQARRPDAHLLITMILSAISLTGRRNMVFLALASAAFTARHLWAPLEGRFPLSAPAWRIVRRGMQAAGWGGMAVAAIYAATGAYYSDLRFPARAGFGATPSYFPHGLGAFLDRWQFNGAVFNSNVLGGHYLYQGFPVRIPLTDGRWEIYDAETLSRARSAPRTPLFWESFCRSRDIEGVLLQHNSPEAEALLPRLGADGRWRLVYLDHAASFWMNTPPGPPTISLIDPTSLPPPPTRLEDCTMLDAFLERVGSYRLQEINLRRALAFTRDQEVTLERLGLVQLKLGRGAEAETTFTTLLTLRPGHATASNELAYMAYRKGNFAEAEKYLLNGLRANPDDARMTENLERLRRAGGGRRAGGPP